MIEKRNIFLIVAIIAMVLSASFVFFYVNEKHERVLHPKLFLDTKGNTHILWQSENPYHHELERIYYSKVDSNGTVLIKQKEIAKPYDGYGRYFDAKMDSMDNIHIIYLYTTQVKYQKIDNNGNSLVAEKVVFDRENFANNDNEYMHFAKPVLCIKETDAHVVCLGRKYLKTLVSDEGNLSGGTYWGEGDKLYKIDYMTVKVFYKVINNQGEFITSDITLYNYPIDSLNYYEPDFFVDNSNNINLFWREKSTIEYRVLNISQDVNMIKNVSIGENVADFTINNNQDKAFISWQKVICYSYEPYYYVALTADIPRPKPIYNLMYAEIDLYDYDIINFTELYNNTDINNSKYISLIYFQKMNDDTIYGVWKEDRTYKYNQWLNAEDFFNGEKMNFENINLPTIHITDDSIIGLKIVEPTLYFSMYYFDEEEKIIYVEVAKANSYLKP